MKSSKNAEKSRKKAQKRAAKMVKLTKKLNKLRKKHLGPDTHQGCGCGCCHSEIIQPSSLV